MDLTQLHPDVLRAVLKLSEEKATLLKQIDQINANITALSTGRAASKAGPSVEPENRARKRRTSSQAPSRRGSLKDQIMDLLSKAGPYGTSVKEISQALNIKTQNIHVWFSSTGKKLPDIVKVGEARYALRGSGAGEAVPSSPDIAADAPHQAAG